MRALDDQVRAGKVLYVDVSDTPAWIVARANTIAAHHGWTPFTAVQVRYNLLERTVERDILPMTRALDLAVTAWGPLGHGLLAGRSDGRAGVPSERDGEIVLAVEAVAENMDATPAQVSLAWLRSRPGVVIPIVGASREAQMRDSLGALDLELDGDDRALLDRASAIDLGFPHEFTRSHRRTPFVLGDAHDRIDDDRADRSGLPLEPEQGMLTDA